MSSYSLDFLFSNIDFSMILFLFFQLGLIIMVFIVKAKY